MPHTRRRIFVLLALVLAASVVSSCRRAIVIVPASDRGYTARDTLYGTRDGNRVRVTFRHDTTWRVDTVRTVITDTIYRGGTRVIARRDTIFVRDTVVRVVGAGRVDTIRVIRRDTVYRNQAPARPDTVRVVARDTVYRNQAPARVDTVYRNQAPPRVDTVRVQVVRVDTLRLTIRDTVVRTVTVRDTVRVAGQRTLFVPPGHYPPEGQCRVWIHDKPPGQQDRAAPCNALGNIPAGAFILFGGEAWDFDYDWVAAARTMAVPPQIVALKRR